MVKYLLKLTSPLCLLLMLSCGKEEIIGDSRKVMPAEAREVQVFPGYKRVKLTFIINDERIKYSKIFYNKNSAFFKVDVNGTKEPITTIIQGLDEGQQTLEVYTYNHLNDSAMIKIDVNIYGDEYVNGLKNREIERVTFMEGDEPYIEWSTPVAGEIAVRLSYSDVYGETRSLIIPNLETITELPMYKENTVVSYSSLYIPEPGCLDTLHSGATVVPAFQKEPGEVSFSTKYVGPVLSGTGDGSSDANAADFLNDAFWQSIKTLLTKGTVTVKFIAGNYTRAYTEKTLTINRIGHAQNRLTLQGDGAKTIFTASTGYGDKTVMIMIRDSPNIRIRNFNFTGNGSLQYALRIYGTPNSVNVAKNILVENCTWTDMRGIIYGATGAHYNGAQHVTYKNCKFIRIGLDHRSHMIYNAYGSTYVNILNCRFEDCTGDFVRFRDKCDYGMVKGSSFIRNPEFQNRFKFISFPLFNDVNPGDESFATNYSITNNVFINASFAMEFYHDGFSPAGYNYLLNKEEGDIMDSGTMSAKKALLLSNFGINTEKVRLSGNRFSNVDAMFMFSSIPAYGAVSRGWSGSVNISNLFNENPIPFSWETL